jgi:hypothetical protein
VSRDPFKRLKPLFRAVAAVIGLLALGLPLGMLVTEGEVKDESASPTHCPPRCKRALRSMDPLSWRV